MWTGDGGTADEPKVYFDSYVMMNLWPVFAAGPANVPGTTFMPVFWYQNFAMLGYWVDCNDDGYIGNSLTGQTAYSATLLASDEKCPEGSDYNNGFEVDEFRAILRVDASGEDFEDPREADYDLVSDGDGLSPYDISADPNDVFDKDAAVWGDWSTPDKDAVPSQGIMPLPPGTLGTWHGHFKYVDDATLGGLSDTVDSQTEEGTFYGIAAALPDTYLGPYEGDSPAAYARYAWNSSSSGKGGTEDCGGADQDPCEGRFAQPYFMAFDCEDSNGTTVDVPAAAEEYTDGDIYAAPVAPGPVNTDGSIDGTTRQNTRAVWTENPGECDEGGVSVLVYDNLETAGQGSYDKKVNADFNYYPSQGERIRFAGSTGLPDTVALPYNGLCGLSELQCWYPVASNSYWWDNHVWSRRPPRATWGVTDSIEITNYADISTDASVGVEIDSVLPSGDSAARYGSEQCTAFDGTVDSHTGTWDCDSESWVLDDPDYDTWWGEAGDFYDLRDEDCYDASVFGNGLLLSCPVE